MKSLIQDINVATHQLRKDRQTAVVLASGDIFEHSIGDDMLNLYRPDNIYGGVANLWLRVHGEDLQVYPLMGRESGADIKIETDRILYKGHAGGIDYRLSFILGDTNTTFLDLELIGNGLKYDLIYGKDLGLAPKAAILTNELYSAQYIDYRSFKRENGWHIAARQNMDQGGRHPFYQTGLLNGEASGFGTDGLDLFGTDFRADNRPNMLDDGLPSEIVQGEFAYLALQTKLQTLDSEARYTFYGYYEADLATAITDLHGMDAIRSAYERIEAAGQVWDDAGFTSIPALADDLGMPFNSAGFDESAIDERYPARNQVEAEEGRTLSFFTPEHEHVVTQIKELAVERAHGHIMTRFLDTKKVSSDLLTTSAYMYGLFNSQTVIGNTSMHKFVSTNRGFLNQTKTAGQRIYVKLDGVYRLLQIPALFEVGMGHSRWIYRMTDGDCLIITTATLVDRNAVVLDIRSEQDQAYDFRITTQVVMGEHEFTQAIEVESLEDGRALRFRQAEPNRYYPALNYTVTAGGRRLAHAGDGAFFADKKDRNKTLLTLDFAEESSLQLMIAASLEDADQAVDVAPLDLEANRRAYLESYRGVLRGFELEAAEDAAAGFRDDVEIMNHTAWWYAHNALVHFAVPHGLEQSGGAAWGTRDVCQGPIEFFYTFGHFDLARDVLLTIFKHQQAASGEWPQWFMFDRYPISSGDCHGDIVFWPLKALSEYLLYTGDRGILEESVPYINADGSATEATTVLEHLKRAYGVIQERFVGDSYLITFAGGDWNDTLQPANESLRDDMVSTWTQTLAYQALHQLGTVLQPIDEAFGTELLDVAEKIRQAFIDYLIGDGVVSGLALRDEAGSYQLLLHPQDQLTGIHYRMLPMTRSIIAELVDQEQAERSMAIVEEQLLFPDGAHLMDHPPRYHGGVTELFVRAEQATYIGRELSLMYTHAHIRYMEALAKLGRGEAWEMSFVINPLTVEKRIPHAAKRQRNLYFSSSDGDYRSREEFETDFDRLKDGSISVKGGWRLYSSGPGIYLHQLVSNILGIQLKQDALEIRPALPPEADGLVLHLDYFGGMKIRYQISDGAAAVLDARGQNIGHSVEEAYQRQTLIISRAEVEAAGSAITVLLPPAEEKSHE